MSGSSEDLLMQGQLQGKISGLARRDWSLFYLEVKNKYMHIFEGHEDPSTARKHLRSLEISSSDSIISDARQFKFTLRRPDGIYTFKCDSDYTRQKWTSALQKIIDTSSKTTRTSIREGFDLSMADRKTDVPKKVDIPKVPQGRYNASHSAVHQPLPPPPRTGSDSGSNSPNDSGTGSVNVRLSKMSMRSDDSGLGVSDNGQVCTKRQHHSGGETHRRPPVMAQDKSKPSSDSGMFGSRSEELENYHWFWGDMNRADSETKMRAEGQVGNFAIRVNASGHYVMTFWRTDGIHHHKIIHQLGIYRFEKTAVQAEGDSLVDLLDNYMKSCLDKKIVPIGGVLHLVYDQAWNPPEIDMEKLQTNLQAQDSKHKRQQFLRTVLQQTPQSESPPPPAQNPRQKAKKEAYTMVSPTSEAADHEFTQSMPASDVKKLNQERNKERAFHIDPTALLPPASRESGKNKALPPPPTAAKSSPGEATQPRRSPSGDKRHSPLPPTPDQCPPTEQSHAPSPKTKHGPTPAPRGSKTLGKTPTSPTLSPPPTWEEQQRQSTSSSTSLTPPPQEQAIYVNTDFDKTRSGKRFKKKPIPSPPPSKTSVSPEPEPESDPGGTEVYENTDFGDTSGNSELYANVPRSHQTQRNANGHRSHKQFYQNVGYNNSTDAGGGMAYQNVQFSGRGHRRKN